MYYQSILEKFKFSDYNAKPLNFNSSKKLSRKFYFSLSTLSFNYLFNIHPYEVMDEITIELCIISVYANSILTFDIA